VTPSYEDDISYRIWANDSASAEENSTVYNISNRWDCTWNISTNDLRSTGGFNADLEVGSVTITNTGDANYVNNNCTIGYTFTYEEDESSFYPDFSTDYLLEAIDTGDASDIQGFKLNDTTLSSFTVSVPANTTSLFVVKAGFPDATSVLDEQAEFNLTADIVDTQTGAETETITAQIIVTPGAYLDVEIDSPSNIIPYRINLTAGTVDFTAYIKDVVSGALGPNNTAYNITFNWTIPEALEGFFSGNTSEVNYSVFNDTTKEYLNVTLTFTEANLEASSLGNEDHTLYVYGYGYENSSGNLTLINHSTGILVSDSIILDFECYNESDDITVSACGSLDGDYVAPTTSTGGTTGGGGGGGGGAAGDKFSRSEGTFELLNGEALEFYFGVENTGAKVKTVEEIFVKGDNAEYITIKSGKGKKLSVGEKINITVEIDTPAYFTSGKHLLQFDIVLKDSLGTSETIQKFMTLYILDVSRTEADVMLVEARKYLDWMEIRRLDADVVEDLFNSMNSDYSTVSFSAVQSDFEELEEIVLSAKEFVELNGTLLEQIDHAKEFDINVFETKKLWLLANVIFNRGDYVLAKQRINEAQSMYAYETKGEFGAVYYARKNPLQAFSALIVLFGVGLFGGFMSRKVYLGRKIKLLKKEEKLLLELMELVQSYTFKDNKMSMGEYYESMGQYESKLSRTIAERIKTESALASLSNLRSKKEALGLEKKRLVEMMKDLQDQYLNKGSIETRVYENMLKTYASRLGNVSEELVYLETKKMLRQTGVLHKGAKKGGL